MILRLNKFTQLLLIAILIAGCGKSGTPFSNQAPSFMQDRSKMEFIGSCNMDTINNKAFSSEIVTPSNYSNINIRGWIYDEKRQSIPEKVYILFVESKSRKEYYLLASPDKSKTITFGGKSGLYAAYYADIDASSLPTADYEAMVVATSSGNVMLCASGRLIHR